MTSHQTGPKQRLPGPVLAAAFLFNLGQGVLRPSLPLYLQRSFTANYRMVTLIPVVFGAGKWIASLPTGYLLDRFGRPLMIWGLLLIAIIDLASIMTSTYSVFLGFRALGGVGWAMFATVAATAMVSVPAVQRRGRAVSLLLMSETAGLLLWSAIGGWLYQGVGAVSPFIFESACMLVAAVVVGRWAALPARPSSGTVERRDWHLLSTVLRTPGVLVMGLTNAVLIAIQTGVIVFLFPLYLANRVGVGPEAVGAFISLDDPEFLAGGTVARLVREGREVTYVIVTNGNKGSSDRAITSQHLVPIRQEEQRRAARVLGVERVEFLGYEDGELEDTRNLRRDVTRQIRLWRPELIISQSPKRIYSNFPGWHRDHRITGSVVLDCIYPLARDHLAFPELFPEYEPHQVREVYLVQWEQPSLLVDITDTMEVKLKAIACHVSQVGDLKAVEARMRGRAATLGEVKGQMYAEGFDHVLLPR